MAKTMNMGEFEDFLKNFNGTTFISMKTETEQKEYYTGVFGSTKKVDKMITLENTNPKEIVKCAKSVVLLTNTPYSHLVENIKIKEVKEQLGMDQDQADTFMDQLELQVKAEKEMSKEYEVGERKNGTSFNGCLAHSKKDEHPMINVYFRTNNKPVIDYKLHGEPLDMARFSAYKKPAKVEGEKQADYGIKKVLVIRNYRLENVKEVTMFGETYEIVPNPE